jgi:hypothetical protein
VPPNLRIQRMPRLKGQKQCHLPYRVKVFSTPHLLSRLTPTAIPSRRPASWTMRHPRCRPASPDHAPFPPPDLAVSSFASKQAGPGRQRGSYQLAWLSFFRAVPTASVVPVSQHGSSATGAASVCRHTSRLLLVAGTLSIELTIETPALRVLRSLVQVLVFFRVVLLQTSDVVAT